MIYIQGKTEFHIDGPCAVTLGKFDGIHRGHQKLMDRILAYSKSRPGCKSVVFALNNRDEQLILTPGEQRAYLEAMGIDALIQCPFVPEIYTMTPERFIRRVLREELEAAFAVVGTDFRFGFQRRGDAAFLTRTCQELGIGTDVLTHELYQGQKISSSSVREALLKGDVKLAAALLGRPYSISGSVVHGAHLGTSLGMPTANLVPEAGKLLPRRGVYVSLTELRGRTYRSVTNVGRKPTVDGTYDGAETYIYGMEEELYGEKITVRLLEMFREEKKFDGLDALKEQIRSDLSRGEKYFDGQGTVLS